MWKAVRKILGQDEPSDQAPAGAEQGIARQAPAAATGADAAQAAVPHDGNPQAAVPHESATHSAAPPGPGPIGAEALRAGAGTAGVEVSPPGHAPQGLAAEPTAPFTPSGPGPVTAATGPGAPPEARSNVEASPEVGTVAAAAEGSSPMAAAEPARPPVPPDAGTTEPVTSPDAAPSGAAPPVAAEHAPSVTSPEPVPLPPAPAALPETAQGAAAPAAGTDGTDEPTQEAAATGEPEQAIGHAAVPEAPAQAQGASTPGGVSPEGTSAAAGTFAAPGAPEAQVGDKMAADAAALSAAPTEAAPAPAMEGATPIETAPAPAETAVPAPAEGTAPPAAPPGETAVPTPAAAETAAPAAPIVPLAAGTVVGDRYTIAGLVEEVAPAADALTYHASDTRSYERCWSCGSTANGPSTRFCQNCGAPIQDHPVTLVQTREPAGEPGEIEQEGAYFHVEPERRMFGAEGVGIEIGAHSAEGPHHPNEDSYWFVTRSLCANSRRQSTSVIVFADGMGGYAPGSGLISARIAETTGTTILNRLDARGAAPEMLDEAEAEAIAREAIAAANEVVLAEIARKGEMGATLVAVMVVGETAYVANVGDSRAYYVDPHGRATAITRDQSLVAQEVQQGHLAESDIYTAIGNNIILHAVGEPGVEDAADFYTQPLEPGSYLLVCSDGYWKTLHGAVVPDDVRDESASLSEMARRMVDDALAQGSDDNTTVLLIAVS